MPAASPLSSVLLFLSYIQTDAGVPSVRLRVSSPYVTEGKLAAFSCNLTHASPSATLVVTHWQRDGENLTLDNPHYSINAAMTELFIRAVRQSDNGSYQCFIRPSGGGQTIGSNAVALHVLARIKVNAVGASVLIGRSATLSCLSVDDDVHVSLVFWSFRGKVVNNARERGYRAHGKAAMYLTVKNVTREKAGDYKCTLVNPVKQLSGFARLAVEYPPVILEGPQNKTVDQGSAVELRCNVSAFPLADIKWTVNNTWVGLLGQRFVVENGQLSIRNAHVKDSGSYWCIANNSHGVAPSIKAHIDVRAPDAYLTLKFGQNATLSCPHAESEKIVWTFKGPPIVQTEHVRVNSRAQVVFTKATRDQTGIYQCTYISPTGEYVPVHRISVTVEGPPSAPHLSAASVTFESNAAWAELHWTAPLHDGNFPLSRYVAHCFPSGKNGLIIDETTNSIRVLETTVTFSVPYRDGMTHLYKFFIVVYNEGGYRNQSNSVFVSVKPTASPSPIASNVTVTPSLLYSPPLSRSLLAVAIGLPTATVTILLVILIVAKFIARSRDCTSELPRNRKISKTEQVMESFSTNSNCASEPNSPSDLDEVFLRLP